MTNTEDIIILENELMLVDIKGGKKRYEKSTKKQRQQFLLTIR